MSIKEYVGSIVLEVDSQEIEITDFDVQINTGRKLVKTMNKTGRAKALPVALPPTIFLFRRLSLIPTSRTGKIWKV